MSLVPTLLGHSSPLLAAGRLMDAIPAVSRDESSQLAAAAGQREDRRNMYLAREGTIDPASPAYQALSQADRNKRDSAAAEKKVKLKNPNYFVSKTRLSIRNLPLEVDEKEYVVVLV